MSPQARAALAQKLQPLPARDPRRHYRPLTRSDVHQADEAHLRTALESVSWRRRGLLQILSRS
jgi:hypothetical protein